MSLSTKKSDVITQNQNFQTKNNLRTRSFQFSLEIIKYTRNLPNNRKYWTFSDQLLRSSTLLGANIIEAKVSSFKRDCIHFYQIVLKSGNETPYRLSLLKESKLDDTIQLSQLINESVEISPMLGSSLLTMKGKREI
jgi:four helix bundle protein